MRFPKPSENMDEIWRDFYATLKPANTDIRARNKEREGLIHFAWMYNSIASTGTATPVDESKYVIGGCCVSDNDPTHECSECGWQRFQEDSSIGRLLD